MKRNFIWIKALIITLILALALSVVGCNNTDEGTNPDQEQSESLPIVTYFKISGQRTVSTTVGQTYQISFIDLPDGASDYVVFSAQGDSVTVSSGGLVTAVKAGQATVTASYGKLSDSITVTVSENTGSGDNSGSGSGSGSSSPSGSTSTAGVVVNGITIPEYNGSSGYYVLNGNTPFFTEDELKFTGYKYSALDSLGRATGAVARLTKSLMPTDARDSISHIKPTGWINNAYSSLNLDSLYNRSHLLAHALMSDDVHKENLITGTTYMNQKVMTTFEDQLLAAVKNGTDVMYRVTPIYKGNNLVASGLLLEAWSMDGGDDICFCVYLYNVQPGVVIDYATGNNWLEGADSDDSGSGSGSTEGGVNSDVIFSFGANGQASVADGSSIGATKDFTEGGQTLTIYSASRVYDSARDAKGTSALKIGKADEIGYFSFNVGADVTSVIIRVAGYKASDAAIEINGKSYTVTAHSNDGIYTAITIDTTEVKTVTFSTTTSVKRAMIDSIEFVVTK